MSVDGSLAALLASVLGASLVGSLHCVGMCGGLVAFATGSANGKRRALPHLAYQGGRLLSYATLGLAAGLVGSAVNLAGSLAGLSEIAALLAAGTIVFWALASLLKSGWQPPWPAVLHRAFSGALARLQTLPAGLRAMAIGLSTGLLPCGWLYAFVVTAAGTASGWRGALVLSAFWLGSVPALLGIGSLAQLLNARMRRHLPALSAVVLLFVGLTNLWTRYTNPADIPGIAAAANHGPAQGDDVEPKPSCH